MTVYNELILTGGSNCKLNVIEKESVTKTIELPLFAYSCLIIGHTLIIGGTRYIQMYSLPKYKLVKHIQMKNIVTKLLEINDKCILAGYDKGHLHIIHQQQVISHLLLDNSGSIWDIIHYNH